MKKQEKITFVKNLTEELKSASSVILIDFVGMNVKTQQVLKKSLREVGAKMVVAKNRLFKRAAQNLKYEEGMLSDEVLSGQTALILGTDDPVSPLQVLGKFVEEFEVPKFKVGLVEGSFQSKKDLEKLSTLPAKNVLLGQLLGGLMAPSVGLVETLNANLQKLVYILKEASQKE